MATKKKKEAVALPVNELQNETPQQSETIQQPAEAVKPKKTRTKKTEQQKPEATKAPAKKIKAVKKAAEEKQEIVADKISAVAEEPVDKAPGKKAKKKTASEETIHETTVAPAKKKAVAKPKTSAKAKIKNTVAAPAAQMDEKKTKRGNRLKKLVLQLRFYTKPGQDLFVTGNHALLGEGDIAKALPMHYAGNELWAVTFDFNDDLPRQDITYNYVVRFEDGSLSYDWGNDKKLAFTTYTTEEVIIIDSWNFAGYFENAFYTEPFKDILFKQNATAVDIKRPQNITHQFKVKAPLLKRGEAVFLSGDTQAFGNWRFENAVLLSKHIEDDYWMAQLDLSATDFPVAYKYGVYNIEQQQPVQVEGGNNRFLYDEVEEGKQTIINDGFAVLPDNTWKGAGVNVPVFSLKSEQSFGAGEFSDIKLLVDWCVQTGLKLVQILPVNDTTATHTWLDSYPYAAISAFALHPMFLRLSEVVSAENKTLLENYEDQRAYLNALSAVNYKAVNDFKWEIIKAIYPSQKESTFSEAAYKDFFESNKSWLQPYAVFCFLRDAYNTAAFSNWPEHQQYDEAAVTNLLADEATADAVAIHYFVQYHLHVQLKAATAYAHENGVIVKGDIPIGIYRDGVDAWQQPELFNMNMQTGAPPDDFAITGQNWGFPTYNWPRMKETGFAWWKQRFAQMSHYFDAFRIDHILGFFRIWSIPVTQVEGIMGFFVPAVAVHINEFYERGIWFNYDRYTKPFINDGILYSIFGDQSPYVKDMFLESNGNGEYRFKQFYTTQRQVQEAFEHWENNEHNNWLKQGLFNLLSNVILFEEENSNGQRFHYRFNAHTLSTFHSLEGGTQHQLYQLYLNYFYQRQDAFWANEALQKLPALKRTTNMLICGEDLGMVPNCVPDVMRQLGLLSLEIQRMPKDPNQSYFHPNNAPYLSIVTPSTHDMSTIRGWWEENRSNTQKFYNTQLGFSGDAPFFCEAYVNEAIVIQHLYSPAMWSIFLLQDILGIDKTIRRANPHEERINVPANPKNYWQYRMHLSLEQLIKSEAFNTKLKELITNSNR